jgi:hypothetical protein
MANCRNCQAELQPNQKFCTACGTPVESAPAVRSSQPAPVQRPPRPAATGGGQTSLQTSLGRLGVPVSLSAIIGFFTALVVGLIVPRVLPYIFPLFYPILNVVFRGSPDTFNKVGMTGLTFMSSFVVSFVIAYLPKRLNRR